MLKNHYLEKQIRLNIIYKIRILYISGTGIDLLTNSMKPHLIQLTLVKFNHSIENIVAYIIGNIN